MCYKKINVWAAKNNIFKLFYNEIQNTITVTVKIENKINSINLKYIYIQFFYRSDTQDGECWHKIKLYLCSTAYHSLISIIQLTQERVQKFVK